MRLEDSSGVSRRVLLCSCGPRRVSDIHLAADANRPVGHRNDVAGPRSFARWPRLSTTIRSLRAARPRRRQMGARLTTAKGRLGKRMCRACCPSRCRWLLVAAQWEPVPQSMTGNGLSKLAISRVGLSRSSTPHHRPVQIMDPLLAMFRTVDSSLEAPFVALQLIHLLHCTRKAPMSDTDEDFDMDALAEDDAEQQLFLSREEAEGGHRCCRTGTDEGPTPSSSTPASSARVNPASFSSPPRARALRAGARQAGAARRGAAAGL